MAQDKFHYAITRKTAAQIILERANANNPNMGLMVMKGEQPTIEDIKVAKNYLSADELHELETVSELFLLFAETKAFRGQKMTMEELTTKLNMLLMTTDYPVLYEYSGPYIRSQADAHAKKQLDIFRAQLHQGTEKKALEKGKPGECVTEEEFEATLKKVSRRTRRSNKTSEGDANPV